MATALHLATVAFSVRNILVQVGPVKPEQALGALQALWDPRLVLEEVRAALAELVRRKMVAERSGVFAAVDRRPYRTRGAAGNMALAADDSRAWEGWS